MSEIHLSIIIPAYKERERITANLEEIAAFISAQEYVSEVIVVIDGSDDGTADIAVSYTHLRAQRDKRQSRMPSSA